MVNGAVIATCHALAEEEGSVAVQEASRLDPGNASVQQLLAVSRMSQGDIPDALVAFRQAINLKPDLREAYINMASALKEVSSIIRKSADLPTLATLTTTLRSS